MPTPGPRHRFVISVTRRVRAGAHRLGVLNDGSAELARRLTDLIDAQCSTLRADDAAPGIAVLLRLSDGRRLVRCTGFADIASRRPIALDSVFQVMSISKPFTALVAAR